MAEQAVSLGLDRAQFEADLVSDKAVKAVEAGLAEAQSLGLGGTPSIAVNGFHYGGNRDLWTLSAIVDLLKLEQRDYTSCPATIIDVDQIVPGHAQNHPRRYRHRSAPTKGAPRGE